MTTTFPYTPQVDPVGTVAYRVRSARFGDGYSQSVADGINNRVTTWPLTFLVSDVDAAGIIAFFDGLQGYQSFYWTPPSDVQSLFQCTGFQHTPHGAGWNTITATFEQVYRLPISANLPTVTSLSPNSGAVGISITLTGTNFTGATAVSFNGTAAVTFAVTNATTMTATVPVGTTTGPVNVTTPNGTSTGGATFTLSSFTPASLFLASEVGTWLDPSDFSVMFQDTTTATAVTAAGQSVGLILDKSKTLTRGSEIVANSNFATNASWSAGAGWTIAGNGTCVGATASSFVYQGAGISPAPAVGDVYEITFTISAYTSGSVKPYIHSGALYGPSYSSAGTFRTYIVANATTAEVGFQGASFVGTITLMSLKKVAGNHASQATSANRPLLQQDAGLKYYLAMDGVNTAMQTGVIPFAGASTTKMTAWCGVRMNAAGAYQTLIELSSNADSTAGTFAINAPGATANSYYAELFATASLSISGTTYTQPITNTVSCQFDMAAASVTAAFGMKVNGSTPGTLTPAGSAPTSTNFASQALYIGARNGASARLTGRIYSVIVRGVLSTGTEMTNTETWVDSKTGAY